MAENKEAPDSNIGVPPKYAKNFLAAFVKNFLAAFVKNFLAAFVKNFLAAFVKIS